MNSELQHFLIKLIALLVIGPFVGLFMVNLANFAEDAWKTNNRKKKWVFMSTMFAIFAGLLGWFR